MERKILWLWGTFFLPQTGCRIPTQHAMLLTVGPMVADQGSVFLGGGRGMKERGASQMYSHLLTPPTFTYSIAPPRLWVSFRKLGALEQGSHCMRKRPCTAIKRSSPYKNNSTRRV